MKKVSLAALVVALTSTAAMAADAPCPKAFQGFHLGGNIGYGVGVGKHTLSADGVRLHSHKSGINGVDGGIGTGYLHRFGNWGLGIAFDANWANSSSKTHHGDITQKTRLKNSLELYGKAGYVICEKTMPFIALGWDNSQWNHSVSNTVQSFSKHKRLNAFMWKAGVDFLATRHVVLGFEYTGTTGGKHSVSNTVNGYDYKASFKPQYNKFALTARVVY